MYLHIDADNGVPVYEQIARQLSFLIADGSIKPGEMIPSVRQLARDLAVNPNTIARAYRQLQDRDVVEPVSGTGLEVTRHAVPICRRERDEWIRWRLAQVIAEARSSRIDDDDLKRLFESALKAARAAEKDRK
ncbi:MAG TPA: GntR family transcriptional regulator [Pirellulaceae bacterium]|nr:GntR family transcriptional regulator [Pirellulaceae bacterium]